MNNDKKMLTIEFEVEKTADGSNGAKIINLFSQIPDIAIPSAVIFNDEVIPVTAINDGALTNLESKLVFIPPNVSFNKLFSKPRKKAITVSPFFDKKLRRDMSRLRNIVNEDANVSVLLPAGHCYFLDNGFTKKCQKANINVSFGIERALLNSFNRLNLRSDNNGKPLSDQHFEFKYIGE